MVMNVKFSLSWLADREAEDLPIEEGSIKVLLSRQTTCCVHLSIKHEFKMW